MRSEQPSVVHAHNSGCTGCHLDVVRDDHHRLLSFTRNRRQQEAAACAYAATDPGGS